MNIIIKFLKQIFLSFEDRLIKRMNLLAKNLRQFNGIVKLEPGYKILEIDGDEIKEAELVEMSLMVDEIPSIKNGTSRGFMETDGVVFLANYVKNPVVLLEHESRMPPIGRVKLLKKEKSKLSFKIWWTDAFLESIFK